MDIWWAWCKRTGKCAFCKELITVSEPMVVGKMWRKGDPASRKWNLYFRWHPKCYIETQTKYLEDNPYTPGAKRGPKSDLSSEDNTTRAKLVRRFGAVLSRRQKLSLDHPNYIVYALKLEQQMMDIAKEMIDYGGVPQSWMPHIEKVVEHYVKEK